MLLFQKDCFLVKEAIFMLAIGTSFCTEHPPGLKQALESSDGVYGHSWIKEYFPKLFILDDFLKAFRTLRMSIIKMHVEVVIM